MWKKNLFMAASGFVFMYAPAGVCDDSSTNEPPPMTEKEKEDEARRLFTEASAAMNEGNFTQACGQFEAALDLLPQHLNTAIKLGHCYERAGYLATALDRYSYAKKLADSQKKDKWINFLAHAIDSVTNRVSWLVVVVPERVGNIQDLKIMRDGTGISRVDWGMRVPIDRGQHKIWATAPGRKLWVQDVLIDAERTAYRITIENLEAAPQTNAQKPPPP